MFADLVAKNRSFRRFYQEPPVVLSELESYVAAARVASSGGNLQALKFRLSADPETNARIFPSLRWAGYLKDWSPAPNERPTGYILILRDNEVTTNFLIDHGIAAEVIRLAAIEKGVGSCIVGSIDRAKLRAALEIPARYEILIAVALGRPSEKVVLEEMQGDDVKYWRDQAGVLHVPKRALHDLIVK